MVFLALITLFILIGTSIFLYIKYLDSYWERRGLFHYRSQQKGENINLGAYKAIKARGLKHGGYTKMYRPTYLAVDLNIIKAILIKDADHFVNRGMFCNPKIDPMSATLPRLENEQWKNVRSVVSPIFSSGKLKSIFSSLADHTTILQEVVGEAADTNEPLEAKDIAKRFGMDSMGSCTFGLEINTLKGHNKDFQELTKNILAVTWKKMAENIISRDILKFLRLKMSDPKIEAFVRQLISDSLSYRQKNNIHRNDIFEYVQQLTDEKVSTDEMVRDKKLSKEQMVITLHTFFTGGFETSSTVTAFAMLELALRQNIQEKLRQNIIDRLKAHGKLTYDAIMDMEYLDWVIQETLRKNPPAPHVGRVCTKSYTVPGTDFIIYPGEFVSIPILGVQMDPEYYSNPEEFDPERFSPENKAQRHPMTFLPFGDGPRNCVGARLGQLLAKVAVAALISKFRVTLNEKTLMPIQYNKRSLTLDVKGGIWVNFTKLEE